MEGPTLSYFSLWMKRYPAPRLSAKQIRLSLPFASASKFPSRPCYLHCQWRSPWFFVGTSQLALSLALSRVRAHRVIMWPNCILTPSFAKDPRWGMQWNLRIKDKLVHQPLSTIRRLSFIGGFWYS